MANYDFLQRSDALLEDDELNKEDRVGKRIPRNLAPSRPQ